MTLYRSMGAALEDDNSGTEPVDVRKDLGGLFVRPGVLPGGVTPLVTGSAGWQYTVKRAAWVTSRGTSDGMHLWGNDGDILVGSSGVGGTVTAAPGAGLSRIDIIYALHPSNGENSDATSEPTVAVAVGTPGSPGLAPSLPVGALELGRNTMTSTATTTASSGNTIAQTAPYAAPAGGVIPVRNATERDALTAFATAEGPITVDRLDLGILERSTGSGWQSLTGVVTGLTSVGAFARPAEAGPTTLLASTLLTNPFSGNVIVEADLVGDASIAPNISVKFLLTAGGVQRFAWGQNFSTAGVVTDSPNVHSVGITTAAAAAVSVAVANVGTGGVSATAGQMAVQWVVRPAI